MRQHLKRSFLWKALPAVAILLGMASFTAVPVACNAQDTLHLFSVTYIKLKDASFATEYESLLNYYAKAASEYNVKTGKIQGYYAWKVLEPSGSANEYDYAVVMASDNITTLVDDTSVAIKQALPGMGDDVLKNIQQQYSSIRTIVKKEIYTSIDALPFSGAPHYAQVNFMKPAAGKADSYVKAERETWKPIHVQRKKMGGLTGWELDQKIMPYSGMDVYDFVTVDFYDSLPMLLDGKYPQAFKAAWPKLDMNKVASEVDATRTIVKTDLLKHLFSIDAASIKKSN